MLARMKDNLIQRYQLCDEFNYRHRGPISSAPNELVAAKEIFGMDEYFKTKLFLKKIEGQIVELVFTHGDAFEKHDNNHWLPSSLWESV